MTFRRTGIIAVLLILAVFGIWWVSRAEKKDTVYGSLSTESVQKVNALLERDSDADGLKDWEEELWGTDPANPDTDGDGTPDGIEVSSGKDPRKAGPDDTLNTTDIEQKTTLAQQGEPTLTDSIARNFFAEYLALKQNGQPLTAEGERQLLLSFFNNPPPLESVTLYSEDDLDVTTDTSSAALKEYGNTVALIFQKYAHRGRNELEILTEAVEREDASLLEGLDERVAVYENALRELLSVPSPKPVALHHVDMVNAMSAIAQSVAGMKFTISDPARALGSMGNYPHGFELLSNSFDEIKQVLLVRGISFAPSEPGAALLE